MKNYSILEQYVEFKRPYLYILIKNFYALEACASLINKFDKKFLYKKSVEKLIDEFNQYKKDYYSQFALMLYEYLVLSIAGELRHFNKEVRPERNIIGEKIKNILFGFNNPLFDTRMLECKEFNCSTINTQKQSIKRNEIYRNLIHSSQDVLKLAEYLFDDYEFNWDDCYGGRPWQYITKIAQMYKKVPDSVFIDTIVDLQHNSGSVFDKHNDIFDLPSESLLRDFLNFKKDSKHETDFLAYSQISHLDKQTLNFMHRIYTLLCVYRNVKINVFYNITYKQIVNTISEAKAKNGIYFCNLQTYLLFKYTPHLNGKVPLTLNNLKRFYLSDLNNPQIDDIPIANE